MLKRFILFIPIIIQSACLEEQSGSLDKKAFIKIYDNSEFHSSFYAIDMKQTSDGGYLILGGKTELDEEEHINTPVSVYLLKVDQYGNKENELEIEDYVYPIGKLNQIGGSYYFVCMNAAMEAQLVNVDELAEISIVRPLIYTTSQGSFPISFPLASSMSASNKLVLMGYDNGSHETLVSTLTIDINNNTVTTSEPSRFFAGTEESPIDNLVVKHANKQGTQFPFAIGQVSPGKYYFNGFYNSTFSLVFTNLAGDDDVQGVLYGQQQGAGVSTILPISGSTFAISTFSFGFNFVIPNAIIETNDPDANVTDIQENGFSFPELENNARITAIQATSGGRNVIVFGSNTKSKQIGLYFYDEATGEFLDSEYIGYSNPFEIASIVQTANGDLAVSGTTYIAGRLPRFCLIKISKSSLKGI